MLLAYSVKGFYDVFNRRAMGFHWRANKTFDAELLSKKNLFLHGQTKRWKSFWCPALNETPDCVCVYKVHYNPWNIFDRVRLV